MTPLKLLGFQKSSSISPHFGSFFAVSASNRRLFDSFSATSPHLCSRKWRPDLFAVESYIICYYLDLVDPPCFNARQMVLRNISLVDNLHGIDSPKWLVVYDYCPSLLVNTSKLSKLEKMVRGSHSIILFCCWRVICSKVAQCCTS